MVAAGGPGIGLVDLGEAETSNLATASAMGEQRWRIMRQRQGYMGYCLALLAVTAYNRAARLGRVQGKQVGPEAIEVGLPDISSTDNSALALAAQEASQALSTLKNIGIQGSTFRKVALQLVLRFAGESVRPEDLATLLAESDAAASVTPDQAPAAR